MENSIIQNFDFSSLETKVFHAFKKTKYKRKDLYISARQVSFNSQTPATQFELRIWLGDIPDDSNCIKFRYRIPPATGFGGQAITSFNFVLRNINYNGNIFAQIVPESPLHHVFLSQVLQNE